METNCYIFLGTPECGRRAVLADLIRDGLAGATTLYIAEPERNDEAEKPLADVPELAVKSWKFDDDGNVELSDDGAENVVLLADGEDDFVCQIEAFSALAVRKGWHVARVVTIVDCVFASLVPESADLLKACIHFSDCVLLANRGNVNNAWVKAFQDGYKKDCFPCTFELVKKNRVDNPARVLVDEPRRLTMIFDEDRDPVYDMEFDAENLPDEPFDLVNAADPYFETTDSGARKIALPKIADLLDEYDRVKKL